MGNLNDYFDEVIINRNFETDLESNEPFKEPEYFARWQRLAYLLYCNNGIFDIKVIGVIVKGNHIFKSGLTLDEALELALFAGTIVASNWYDNSVWVKYQVIINGYLNKLLEIHMEYLDSLKNDIPETTKLKNKFNPNVN